MQKGSHHTKESIEKIRNIRLLNPTRHWLGKKRPSVSGSNNYQWKGETVSYRNLHRWVERMRGKPFHCEACGIKSPPYGKGLTRNYFQWANISGNYLRILEDWKQLCYRCHAQMDAESRRKKKFIQLLTTQ